MKKSIFIITLLLLALTTGIALAQTPEGKEYTVQPGDSLSAIAKKEYGNPQAFPAIVAATNAKAAEDDSFAVIKEARTILVGQKLWLPVQPIPETTVNNEVITMTTPTAWPNLADYPHLVQAQLSNQPSAQEMLAEAGAACPEINTGRPYPLAEPDYTGKRARDLSAFETALADFTPERAAALDALLTGKTIPELQSLLDSGDLTSAELVTYYVDRIRRYDLDKLNSVMELNPEALDIARKLDAERAAGTLRGPMHGIPVLLKDNIATGDRTHTTAGAAALQDWVADRDAFLVQQIRAAGGLILGKANLSEWANFMDPCMPSGFSVVGGQTRHPYGPFDPRGSSSGSAVSVAANLTTVSVGSETSGSLIQPARVNGAVALRPSQGLISRDYVVPLGPDLDTPGPMGRSLTDVAILLNAMTGVDPHDPKTGDAAALAGADFTQFLNLDRARGLRVGIVTDGTEAGKPAEIAVLQAQGIEVVEINAAEVLPYNQVDTAFPQLQYGFQAGLNTFLAGLGRPAPVASIAEVVAFNEADMANRAPYGQGFVKWSAETDLTAADQAQILAEAQAYATAWMNALVQTYHVDVVNVDILYAANAGAAGVPALTIPTGLDAKGQPTSIILSGPYLSDPDLLTVGYVLEQALQGRVEPDLDATIKQIETVTGK